MTALTLKDKVLHALILTVACCLPLIFGQASGHMWLLIIPIFIVLFGSTFLTSKSYVLSSKINEESIEIKYQTDLSKRVKRIKLNFTQITQFSFRKELKIFGSFRQLRMKFKNEDDFFDALNFEFSNHEDWEAVLEKLKKPELVRP